MLFDVAPLLHKFPPITDEVKVTEFPAQIVVGPLAEMIGVLGNGLTVMLVEAELVDVHDPTICLTV